MDLREALELDADGQPPLQLGQHVAGLALVERPAADEQNVVRAHVAKLGAHLAALYDGQQVALHPLAARIRACAHQNSRIRLTAFLPVLNEQRVSTLSTYDRQRLASHRTQSTMQTARLLGQDPLS